VVSASLDNLQRLGIVSISYDKSITTRNGINPYDDIEKNPILEMLNLSFEKTKEISTSQISWIKKYQDFDKAYIQKGIVELTQFGRNFCSICIS